MLSRPALGVGDDDEAEAGVGRRGPQQLAQRLDPAGRRADADDEGWLPLACHL